MATYNWKGTDRKGSKQSGEIDAENAVIARQLLSRKGVTVNTIKEKPKDLLEYLPFLHRGVKAKDIVIFIRQLATMIDAGVPLVQCLDILEEQQPNKTFKSIISRIRRDVEEGSTFSDALGKHKKQFDNLFVSLVAAGELGGILDTILNRLAVYLEKAASLRKKVKGAMTYPIVVMAIALLVIAVILIYVIPTFAGLFKDAGVALPSLTLLVMNLSKFVQDYIIWMIAGMCLLLFLLKRFRRTPQGRQVTDRMLLRMPVFGMLIKKVAVARFTRTLGTLLASGVPILEALDIVASTAGNVVIEAAIRQGRASIAEGNTVSEPLAETKIFPGMVTQMISVGESTGALDAMLNKIAEFYEEEVDAAVEAMTSLLEPLLIVFLGTTIGGLLIAMYLPIFQIADVASRGH